MCYYEEPKRPSGRIALRDAEEDEPLINEGDLVRYDGELAIVERLLLNHKSNTVASLIFTNGERATVLTSLVTSILKKCDVVPVHEAMKRFSRRGRAAII